MRSLQPNARNARSGAALVPAARLLAQAVLALLAAAPAAAQPTLTTSVAGFTDVNHNGVLDCGEPVIILAAFATNNSNTPALTGSLFVPSFGTSGLTFLSGSVVIEPDLTVGCTGSVVSGNNPGDGSARADFSCPPDPLDNNAWTFVVRYQAVFTGTTASATVAAHAVTSDGNTYNASASQAAGTPCAGAPAAIAVSKSAAGPATPGSTLVYTVGATDTSGLGQGGLQLVDTVPAHTVFAAGASSPGWTCAPDANPGALCRNPVGNLDPGGSLSRFFAVTLDPSFPAGGLTIANTACVRLGPTVVAGCASTTTPAAGSPLLHLGKTLASGLGVPGTTLAYALAAANTGNQDLADVQLQETVPAHTSFSAGASATGWSCVPGPAAGSACTLDLGALAAGAAASRSFAVVVDNPLPALPPGAAIANTACLTTPLAGVAPSCATVSTPTAGAPSLHTVKTLVPGSTAVPGATLLYDLAVSNTGNEGAGGVNLNDTVPLHTTFAAGASSAGWGCVPGPAAGSVCTLSLGPLAAGATVHSTFAVVVERPLAAGVTAVANTACAQLPPVVLERARAPLQLWRLETAGRATARSPSFAGATTAAAAAAAPGCDTVTTPTLGRPLLSLTKSYAGGPVEPGALLVFHLAAANSGDQDAAAAVLDDTVPAHSNFAPAASTPGWACTPGPAAGAHCTLALGPLPAGSTAAAIFAVRADSPLPAAVQQIANAACLTAAGGLTACGQTATPPAVFVAAELQDSFARDANANGLADPGDDILYTLTVSNPSGGAAQALHVATPLDPHLALDAGSVTTTAGTISAGNHPGDTVPTLDLPSLAPGAAVTMTFTATVAPVLPPGLRLLASQSILTGANFPATVSDDPDTPEPLDPTTTPVGTPTIPPIAAIPTLSTWGLLLLGMALAGISCRRLRRGRSPALLTLPPADSASSTEERP
ncbi:MAG TPA: IPTL-CTERM sorting domain-containing protein [Thermoanaerobaculia bacterium]|nr:IPTL-CTERM sorting domain-containing protein [Thermoanaerobaculia bacterium]